MPLRHDLQPLKDLPFGIDLNEMLAYAIDQFNRRFAALERAGA
jgi:hypothetical protein